MGVNLGVGVTTKREGRAKGGIPQWGLGGDEGDESEKRKWVAWTELIRQQLFFILICLESS